MTVCRCADLREIAERLDEARDAYAALVDERDGLIVLVSQEGKSLREVAALAMMSHAGVAKVLAR